MKPGISFIVRVAEDDEPILARSLLSLQGLTIPHRVIAIRAPAYAYDGALSRAGFENLVTPALSPHSLPSFLEWCMAHAEHLWQFRWDADFIATPALIEFLNSRKWDDQTPTRIRIPQSDGNNEPVLFNAGRQYGKFIFWEYNRSIFEPHVREERITALITHASPLTQLKTYWDKPAWFADLDTEEAAGLRMKYSALVGLIGPEPPGMARARNPACDVFQRTVQINEMLLNREGIDLWN